MTGQQLFEYIKKKKSYLCIGLDSDPDLIPEFLKESDNPVFEFNKHIIDATHTYAVAYKPNLAFYESMGNEGWLTLRKTVEYIRVTDPRLMIIADAKRGDIGNTSKMYARAFFESMNVDAVTVAPYMGEDSVTPFLSYPGRWVVLLALTSNKGASDFQYHSDDGIRLFERVLSVSKKWGNTDNLMYVVGATRAEMLVDIRKIVPDHFLLVPGVGAQGGSLEAVSKYGLNRKCGLLVNSSRGIIFADRSENFARIAAEKAHELQAEMSEYLVAKNLV